MLYIVSIEVEKAKNGWRHTKYYNKVTGKFTKLVPNSRILDYTYEKMKDATACAKILCVCNENIDSAWVEIYDIELFNSKCVYRKK